MGPIEPLAKWVWASGPGAIGPGQLSIGGDPPIRVAIVTHNTVGDDPRAPAGAGNAEGIALDVAPG